MKTLSHNSISKHCLSWLYNRATQKGIRGDTEVQLAPQYVADAFALCHFQIRFYEKYCPELMEKAKIGQIINADELACVFEAKVSRPDFLKTFKSSNRYVPIGNLHWCVARKGIAKPEEVFPFWGFIEVRGSRFYELKKPSYMNVSIENINKFAHSLLWTGYRHYDNLACPDCGKEIRE
jgi:hypothetical protein